MKKVLLFATHESMKKIYSLLILLIFTVSVVQAVNKTSTGTGNWNTSGTWSPAGVPAAGDAVTIAPTHTVTLDINTASLLSLTVNGTLSIGDNTSRTITVTGNVTVASTGTITIANFNDTHIFNIGGNLSNAGVFDMNTGSNDLCDITFNGAANQTVSGSGGTTDFNEITINNTGAANNNIVEISSTNFSTSADFLTLTDGIFKLSGTFTFSNNFFSSASYTINSDEGLWLNNPNVTVTGQSGSPILNGLIRVTNGTYNIGSASGNSLRYNTGASFTLEGGAVIIAGRFVGDAPTTDQIIFNMSGGTLTVANIGNATNSEGSFDIGNAGSSFTMSGGTIILRTENTAATPLDYRNIAGTVSITGGTVQFATAATTGSPTFVIGVTPTTNIFPGLSLVKAVGTTTATLSTPITIRGNLDLASSSTLNANGQAVSVTGNTAPGTSPGNWTNNGTFTSGTQTTTFNGSAAQDISGANSTTFSSLIFNNTLPGTGIAITFTKGAFINGAVTFTDGIVKTTSSNFLTFNAGSSILVPPSTVTNASFVEGPVQKIGTTLFTFPVGKSGAGYHPIEISASAGSTYTANYFRASALTKGPVDPTSGLYGVSNCEYWELTKDAGANVDVKISWTETSPCGGPYVTQTSGLTVAWLNGSTKWQVAPGTATNISGTTAAGTVQRVGVSNYGFFALGNLNANGSPLPVKFANVKASKKASGIEVSFSNLTESDVVNYSIERSAKGQQYSTIKELAPAKNDGGSADYSYTDAQPLSGNNLYRIKSVETNGKISYSAVARVDLEAKGLALTIAPNPAKSTELGLQITNLPAGNYKIRIFNNNAQLVGEQLLKHTGGSFSQTLPLNKLQAGMYYLKLNGAVKMQKQFIVQ